MKNISKVLLIVILLDNSGCGQKLTEENNTSVSYEKIAISTGGCYGFCPFQSIEIDSGLYCQFYGGDFAEPQGYYTGLISARLWDSIQQKLNSIDVMNLDSSYAMSEDDVSFEVIVYNNGERKQIYAQSLSLPDSVRKAFEWFLNIHKKIDLVASIDQLDFESKLQFPVAPPEPPGI